MAASRGGCDAGRFSFVVNWRGISESAGSDTTRPRRREATMHKVMLAGLLATTLAAPVAAYAQPAAPPARSKPTEEVMVIRPAQWLAIGAGAVVGAALLDVIL